MSTPSLPPGDRTGGPVRPDHQHPPPPALRVVAVLLAIGLALFGTSVVQGFADSDRRDQQLAETVRAELDRRTTARDAETAARDARLRRTVCAVLAGDLPKSSRTQQLAVDYGCTLPVPTPTAPSTTTIPEVAVPSTSAGPAEVPRTGPSTDAPRSTAAPRASPSPARRQTSPTPAPSPSRSPTAQQSPATTPSPTCRPVLGLPVAICS